MKAPCTDWELEGRYIGAAMVDPDTLRSHPLAIAALDLDRHKQILEALIAMTARGAEVSPVSLGIELDRLGYGQLAAWQPFEKLACLCPDIEQVAVRLRELAVLRELYTKLLIATQKCVAGEGILAVQAILREASEIADRAEVDRIAISGLREAADECVNRIMQLNDGGAPIAITSGIPALDWDAGDLVVIAGDPSAGKSTTMLLAALAQAAQGHRPGIISLEDSRERWGRRALSAVSGVAVSVLKGGRLSHTNWEQLNAACSEGGIVKRLSVQFAYPLGGTIDEVIACVRRMRHEHRCDMVYVDYLQAIAGGTGDDKQVRHHIRDCLEAMRRELGSRGGPLTIAVGSQYKKRDDDTKRPSNSDLYEAAYIHQKADAILHLWRNKRGVRNAWLGKHKDGDELSCELHIDPQTRRLMTQSGPPAYVGMPDDDQDDFAARYP